MLKLSAKQVLEFYHRSYTTVDGLWYMKVEEKYGYDAALEIDNDVWKVLPKMERLNLVLIGPIFLLYTISSGVISVCFKDWV